MTDNQLIDDSALDVAVKWTLEAQDKGERFIKEFGVRHIIAAYVDALPKRERDYELRNMLNAAIDHLCDNRPVPAYEWINNIRTHLEKKGII